MGVFYINILHIGVPICYWSFLYYLLFVILTWQNRLQTYQQRRTFSEQTIFCRTVTASGFTRVIWNSWHAGHSNSWGSVVRWPTCGTSEMSPSKALPSRLSVLAISKRQSNWPKSQEHSHNVSVYAFVSTSQSKKLRASQRVGEIHTFWRHRLNDDRIKSSILLKNLTTAAGLFIDHMHWL